MNLAWLLCLAGVALLLKIARGKGDHDLAQRKRVHSSVVTSGRSASVVVHDKETKKMIRIAVTCRSVKNKSAQEQFENFCSDIPGAFVPGSGKTVFQIVWGLQFHRVATSLDLIDFPQDIMFDGVIRLSQLAPDVEWELIQALRPPLPL